MKSAESSVRVAPPWRPGKPLEPPYPVPGAPEPARSAETSPPATAIIIAHGMGQQVPFETLDQVAGVLRAAEQRANGTRPTITVRRVKLAEQELTRAELEITARDGRRRHVHVYETYWAPITEGKVTVRDTMQFLATAGLHALLHGPLGVFRRFLYNQWQTHRVGWRTRAALLGALLVTASLVLMNAVIVLVTALRVASTQPTRWTNGALLGDLTVIFALFFLVSIVLSAVGIGVPKLVRRAVRPDGSRAVPPPGLLAVCWTCVWLAVLAVVLMAPLVVAAFAWQHLHEGVRMFHFAFADRLVGAINRPAIPTAQMLLVLVVWGVALLVSARIRRFLLQYVGDVAAYISSHTVSKFYETRRAIQDAAFRTVRDVYASGTTAAGAPVYASVVMAGHSLGSVIAYDMMNAIVRHDLLLEQPIHAARRTAMLLTFGSPLDKTAFLFRMQKGPESEVREASAAAVQSLVDSVDLWPKRWVNIWNKADWISGSLEFYDPPRAAVNVPRVENLVDPEATTPVLAHTEYWSNRLFGDTLREAALA